MTTSNWDSTQFNYKFFAYNAKPMENSELIENLSGRVVAHRKNTKALLKINCSVRFTRAELEAFWLWFNDTLGQTSGAFYCGALGNGLYRFSKIPEPQDTDQVTRTLTLEIEQVI